MSRAALGGLPLYHYPLEPVVVWVCIRGVPGAEGGVPAGSGGQEPSLTVIGAAEAPPGPTLPADRSPPRRSGAGRGPGQRGRAQDGHQVRGACWRQVPGPCPGSGGRGPFVSSAAGSRPLGSKSAEGRPQGPGPRNTVACPAAWGSRCCPKTDLGPGCSEWSLAAPGGPGLSHKLPA